MPQLTRKEDGKRVCVEANLKGYTYPKYILAVLVECGFSHAQDGTGISFTHNDDTDLKVVLSVDLKTDWHHLISYKHSRWSLIYEGDVDYHVFGNSVLKTIRKAYTHWHGF